MMDGAYVNKFKTLKILRMPGNPRFF